jgi:FlaA1/EpsC-like NDP-sugar epimerase
MNYIFGAGEIGRKFLTLCGLVEEFQVVGAFDNDSKKICREIEGITILEPQRIPLLERPFKIFITLEKHIEDVIEQLRGYGLEYGRDFYNMKSMEHVFLDSLLSRGVIQDSDHPSAIIHMHGGLAVK